MTKSRDVVSKNGLVVAEDQKIWVSHFPRYNDTKQYKIIWSVFKLSKFKLVPKHRDIS